MKLYRIFPDPEEDQMYLEYSGLSFDTYFEMINGNRIKSVDDHKIEIKNKSKKFPDFTGSGRSEFFINDKFKKILEKFVTEQKINFVEVKIKNKTYWLLNIIGLRDCMDYGKSEFTVFENNGKPDAITKLVLNMDKINEYDIFRLSDKPIHVFITESLKKELVSQKITGIKYIESMDLTYH